MSYNVRLYDYPETQQVRIYGRPVKKDIPTVKAKPKVKEASKKSDARAGRSEAAEKHSKQVSLNRAKQIIYEILRANTWEYFITLTFDREKVDSSDYDLLVKTVGKWFNNVKARKAPELKYFIVPELHLDGIHYHFHGVIAQADGLQFVDSGIVKNGMTVYNMPDFKLGFTTATKVEDTKRVSSYITKYITKDLDAKLKGKRRYLASRNCKRAEVFEYNMTPEQKDDVLLQIADDITFMSTQHISSAKQSVSYIELKK